MQGSYKKNELPRPYYMKPSSKLKRSPYDKMTALTAFFNSSRRKFLGYVVMLFLFGSCIYWMAQDLKPTPEPKYEIDRPSRNNHDIDTKRIANEPAIDNILNAANADADKESKNVQLAKDVKSDKAIVVEAPKGGVANEGAVVGSDEDKIIGTGKNPKNNKGVISAAAPAKGYRASKDSRTPEDEKAKEVVKENLKESVQKILKDSDRK